jgi:hypothetical protein
MDFEGYLFIVPIVEISPKEGVHLPSDGVVMAHIAVNTDGKNDNHPEGNPSVQSRKGE